MLISNDLTAYIYQAFNAKAWICFGSRGSGVRIPMPPLSLERYNSPTISRIGTKGTVFAWHGIGACGRALTHIHCGALGARFAQWQIESSRPSAPQSRKWVCEQPPIAQMITGTTAPTISQLRSGSSGAPLAQSYSEQLHSHLR